MKNFKLLLSLLIAVILVVVIPGTVLLGAERDNVDPVYLETLTNEELSELFAPIWAVAEQFNEYMSTWHGGTYRFEHPLDIVHITGHDAARDFMIYVISSHTAESFEMLLLPEVDGMRHMWASMRLNLAMIESNIGELAFRTLQNSFSAMSGQELHEAVKIIETEGLNAQSAQRIVEIVVENTVPETSIDVRTPHERRRVSQAQFAGSPSAVWIMITATVLGWNDGWLNTHLSPTHILVLNSPKTQLGGVVYYPTRKMM